LLGEKAMSVSIFQWCAAKTFGNATRRHFLKSLAVWGVALGATTLGFTANSLDALRADEPVSRFVDHSLLVAPEYPCTWPSTPFPKFRIIHDAVIGPDSIYHIDTLQIDGNTGSQMDVPPHSVARPDLNREKSGPLGLMYTDRIHPWQFGGRACVIDVRDLRESGDPGVSPLIGADRVEAFEAANGQVGYGDVVLFRSDYTDHFYRPYPEGHRFLNDVLDRKAPGYPDPSPECMEFLGERGVMALGTDSASMGPLPDLAEPAHYAGLKYGMIWTESATNLSELPETGAFYVMLGPRHALGPYGECRAFSIVGGALPAQLIDSCKNHRAVDLSPVLSPQAPLTSPGQGTGRHRQTYLKVDFLYSEYLDLWHHAHLMDSMAGTHLVPPAYALPAPGSSPQYSPEARGWLQEYEQQYGARGFSEMTTDKVPLEWMCGKPRVIDVRNLVGTTPASSWPASPMITAQTVSEYETQHGEIQTGEVVIFRTGHLDRHLADAPHDTGVWADPLSGKSEGWPAVDASAIQHLATRGVKCVATDAPDLGGVDAKSAAMTFWALGSREMVGVEFLYQVGQIEPQAYFLFAPIKIRDCHGGPGRAIVLQ
jgi:kynurenine formamidase